MKFIEIDGKMINRKSLPYTIAEAGINHNGNIELAYEMVAIAKNAGADAIKFQTFKADEFCNKESELYETFKKCEFSEDQWKGIKQLCDLLKITFLSTPQNYSDLELLLKLGIQAIKIGSDDLTNIPLIKRYALTKLPIILSCGMAYESEIEAAINTIRDIDKMYPVIVMHCTSLYPTLPRQVNIRKLGSLNNKYPRILSGYSDHTVGYVAAVMAVAYGAKVLETHFTLDNSLEGPDHKFSKNPNDLKAWITAIHQAYQMLGESSLNPTDKEFQMRNIARRSLTAIKNIAINEVFTTDNIGMMRPGDGLKPLFLGTFLGQIASRNIQAGEQLQREDIYYAQNNNG